MVLSSLGGTAILRILRIGSALALPSADRPKISNRSATAGLGVVRLRDDFPRKASGIVEVVDEAECGLLLVGLVGLELSRALTQAVCDPGVVTVTSHPD